VLYTDPEQFDPRRVNDPYQPSPYLSGLLEKTPSTRFHRVENFGRRNWYFKFKGEGAWDNKSYPGLNKWSSLVEAANAGWFEDFDEVVVLEQDLWFSGEFPSLPAGNCCTDNWINSRYSAFEVTDKTKEMNTDGLDLDDIMKLCKVPSKFRSKWVGGAIIFKFLTNQLQKPKFLNAVMNYNQLLMTLGELALPQGARHETDMVEPSLAMAHCGMDCTLIDNLKWRSDVWTWHQEPPSGTVVHYGWDFAAYPHLKSSFNKFAYGQKPPWTDIEKYKKEIPDHKFKWTNHFISDIEELGKYKMDRTCTNNSFIPRV